MAIYLCGMLAGIAFGHVIISTTFSKSSPLRDSSVHIWGFRAQLGAFIASWGGITMLTSAPFDNWWHKAYGLDIQIISLPHIVLLIGVYAVILGTLTLIAGQMNRSTGKGRTVCVWLFLYVSGIMLTTLMAMLMELTIRPCLHWSSPYIWVSALAPTVMIVASRTAGARFAATFVAGFYTFVNIFLILFLPLFPAEPKLGPVYQQVTHFIPPQFPLLLIVPALALDLLLQHTKSWRPWTTAVAGSLLFVTVLLAVEWPFASFLMTPTSRNRFFGTMYFDYNLPPDSYSARNIFFDAESVAAFCSGILIAITACIASIRFGISRGNWLASVKR
jgi:hypothetical protein